MQSLNGKAYGKFAVQWTTSEGIWNTVLQNVLHQIRMLTRITKSGVMWSQVKSWHYFNTNKLNELSAPSRRRNISLWDLVYKDLSQGCMYGHIKCEAKFMNCQNGFCNDLPKLFWASPNNMSSLRFELFETENSLVDLGFDSCFYFFFIS